MSEPECPSEAELVAYADADLSPEQLNRIENHLMACGPCTKAVAALQQLIQDVAAPSSKAELDVAAHVAGVMKRLDVPVKQTRKPRWALWSGGLAVAAAATLAVALGPAPHASPGDFAARGGAAESSLARDLGVQLYAQEQSLRSLESGSRIHAAAPLTAGLRNLGSEPAYLLLFAVDARDVVHWIAPEYTTAGSDPAAATVAPSPNERLLSNVAVFDDLALGPLEVIAVLTRKPTHVSEVEALSGKELDVEGLKKHFPGAQIRQFLLEVASTP